MNRVKNSNGFSIACYVAVLAFTAAFIFFQFAYPYHLIRREQMTLFVYDWAYIGQTYHGAGWLVRIAADFLEQFFLLPCVGPLIISILLTAIGYVSYAISRKFLNDKWSLAIAVIVFLWSFLRETGNLYMTRYTLAVLIYLSLALFTLNFLSFKGWPVAAVALAAFSVWSVGAPANRNYGRMWSLPSMRYERLMGMDVQVARENWDKVIELSKDDLHMTEASFCYNLAQAMKGNLGNSLLDYTQNAQYTLLFTVVPNQTLFKNCLAGEVWFHLGEMTMAEQSALTSLQVSPNHTGARFIKRLADVNLVTGQEATAQKYLNQLSKTLFYGKWARKMMPECQDGHAKSQLQKQRLNLTGKDVVHLSDNPRLILTGLLEANPDNMIARNYLLCYDLMCCDLDSFIVDYSRCRIDAHIYQEAVLIWLSQHDRLSETTAAEYGVAPGIISRMGRFFRMPEGFRNTYWYYYMNAFED